MLKFFNLYPDEGVHSQSKYCPTLTKSLLSSICLRRPKSAIKLPGRTDEIHKVEFEIDEARLYKEMSTSISASLSPEIGQTHLNTYASVLTKINALRQICNLGTFYKRPAQERGDHRPSAQARLDAILSAGVATCCMCGRDLLQGNLNSESLLGDTEDGRQPKARLAECGEVMCASCGGRCKDANSPRCKHQPSCQFFEVQISGSTVSDVETFTSRLPTKIKALQDDIQAVPAKQKRCVASSPGFYSINKFISIIFSFWTTTLDLVAVGLDEIGVKYARVDGTMPVRQRQLALASLADDSQIQAILISLRCGSNGYEISNI